MDRLLRIEVVVLLLLVAASVFVRMGIQTPPVPTEPDQMQSSKPSASVSPAPSQPSQPQPSQTAPEETQPPIKLTFGEGFTLEARDYFVYDCGQENLMAVSGDLEKKVYPASVTKLFTAYVALQYLDPNSTITLGKEVYMVPSDSSLAHVKMGQRISVAHLVEGMLLPSGNDAAYALAVAAAKVHSGNPAMEPDAGLKYFVRLMNDTASQLGMHSSHFVNPDGYHDPDHYTSCGDLITIARLALSSDLIRQCAIKTEDRVKYSNGEVAVWNNTNALINPESQYYHEDAIGLKTGHTSAAGFCVLTAFELDGEYIIIGTFGCLRPEDRFIDALKLYDLVVEAKT